MNNFNLTDVIAAFADGKFVVVADAHDRENEGDLIMAAEKVTPEAIAFMVRHTSGIICMSMLDERLRELHIPQMVTHNTDARQTAWTISVDFRHGTTTGISATDRAKTIRALIDPSVNPEDFTRPGHIFPLRYCKGGVLKRAGHTEAAIDLARLAGLYPSAILAEIVKDDGSMARGEDLKHFAKEYNLPLISVEDIVRFRHRREKLVECVSSASIPTPFSEFTGYVYRSKLDGMEHFAMVKGDIKNKSNVLVRVHSECLTGDVFGSRRCDCGEQLNQAMQMIATEGCGILLYLRGHEGRGIGLGHKIRAYTLQEQGRDTVEANLDLGLPVDSREYGIGAQILVDLGVTKMRLLTNNPAKYTGLEGYDLEITERIPLQTQATPENIQYLKTKKNKMGHLL